MDKHCVSLEIAKQLKEAGWKKETEFWWIDKISCKRIILTQGEIVYCPVDLRGLLQVRTFLDKYRYALETHYFTEKEIIQNDWEVYFAPLATEILEELPIFLDEDKEYYLCIKPAKDVIKISYEDSDTLVFTGRSGEKDYYQIDKSLPNALAKMWLYLRKEKLF